MTDEQRGADQGPEARRSSGVVRGYLIASVVWFVVLLGIAVLSIGHHREGCERLDTLRGIFYDDRAQTAETLATQRRAAQSQPERAALTRRITSIRNDLKSLRRDSRKYHPADGEYPASVDCDEAYPYPWQEI